MKLESRNAIYAVVCSNKEGEPDTHIVYVSSNYAQAEEAFYEYYCNYDWKKEKYELVQIWLNFMRPTIEFDEKDMVILKKS